MIKLGVIAGPATGAGDERGVLDGQGVSLL